MNFKKIFITTLLIIPLFAFTLHKYYISLTEIEYKKETKSVQIIMNVFMDDIEKVINNENNIDLQLTTKKELKNNDLYFKNYLEENLFIKINQKPYHFNYLGKEYDNDLIFFYLEIQNINNFNSIEVSNTILTKSFSKQQNLIKVKKGSTRKSLLLSKKNDKGLLKF